MNKKIEDIKPNIRKTPIKKVVINNDPIVITQTENHNPTHTKSPEEKYEFLNKRNRKINNQPSFSHRIPQTPRLPGNKNKFSRFIFIIFILSILVGGVYLLSTTFLHANITITAKDKTLDLKDQKFKASKNPGNNVVPFTMTMVSGSDYKEIVLNSSREAKDYAKGSIGLYNEYSTKPIKILAGTFISDEKGKTYKIDSTISIPGYTLDKSKKIIPGQIAANITAFLPGESYNGDPKSFTINSYKGTDKFKKIYAKATSSVSGGVTGLVYVMDDSQKLDMANVDLSKLKQKLLSKIEVPDGYILYDNTVRYSIDYDKEVFSKTPDTKIEIRGTAKAFLLKEDVLSSYIIDRFLPNISEKEKSEIIKPDISKLTFKFTDENQIVDKEIESFDFTLSQSVYLKWNPYVDELKSYLVGKNKNEASNIFKQDPGVLSANVKIIPFWSKILPQNTKNINIILK